MENLAAGAGEVVREGGASSAHATTVTADGRRLLEAVSRLVRENQDVEVDCGELDRLGGSSLPVLLALATEVERRGGRLVLRDAGPSLARIVALAGLRPERLPL